jgi:hypothetical protein
MRVLAGALRIHAAPAPPPLGVRRPGKLMRRIARIYLGQHIPGKIDKCVAHLELQVMTWMPKKLQWRPRDISKTPKP